ncbi:MULTISPECIES: ArdC family protein [Bacteria]
MATSEEARAARDAKLDALHEQLTSAVESLVSGEDWMQALTFAARFRARSFNNTLLIFVQHQGAFEAGRVPDPLPSYVAGFKQWQALGRQVEKGQSGYMILAPVTRHQAAPGHPDIERDVATVLKAELRPCLLRGVDRVQTGHGLKVRRRLHDRPPFRPAEMERLDAARRAL